ncbi:uncharacterized protein JCM15063_003082 [Sporobolomyces koalae]|uniref:uncharacterized protein n=1 Tax=Sporobolomyces koalae TaxID=500713 RepID=UPI00317E5469
MAVDAPTRTVDAVTRLCYYQGASPAAWLRFVRQVGDAETDLEEEATDSLLALLTEAELAPPTILGLLKHAIEAQPSLIRPLHLARALSRPAATALPLSTVEAIFALLNATSDAQNKQTNLVAEETAYTLVALIDNVLSRFYAPGTDLSDDNTTRWTSGFLATRAYTLNAKNLSFEALSTCALKVESLLGAISATSRCRYSSRHSLTTSFNGLLGKLKTRGNKRRSFPRLSNQVRGPDMELFASNLFSSTSRTRAHHGDPEIRLSAILEYRQSEADFRNTEKEQAAVEALRDYLKASLSAYSNSTKSDHVRRSLLANCVPRVLNGALGGRELYTRAVAQALKIVQETPDQDEMRLDSETSHPIALLIAGMARENLVSDSEALSVVPSIPLDQLQLAPSERLPSLENQDAEEIRQALATLATDLTAQTELSNRICQTVASHCAQSDLDALTALCDALLQDTTALQIVFVHEHPRTLLAPIRDTLDTLDTAQDNFGESNLVERYGNLVLFVQVVVQRFELVDNLSYHLGSSASFLNSWIPTSSAAYALSALDAESKTAVAGFIGALFGDGISDDLMHATNPRTLLRIAPTILKQSLVACQHGAVDLESLKDALSYFLQELLSFTLPGVLHWLIGEIERTPPSPAQNAMYDILQVILFAEALPETVLELVSSDLSSLISGVTPASFDTARAKRLLMESLKRSEKLAATSADPTGTSKPDTVAPLLADFLLKPMLVSSWDEQLRHHLASLCQAHSDESKPHPDAKLVHEALTHASKLYSPNQTSLDTLWQLLEDLPDIPDPPPRTLSPIDDKACARWIQIQRCGSALLTQSRPLFNALVHQTLPSLLSTIALARLAVNPLDRKKVEMLADIVAGCFILVLADNTNRDETVSDLEQLVLEVKARLDHSNRNNPAKEGEDADQPTLVQVFLDRLSSYPVLTNACPHLSALS